VTIQAPAVEARSCHMRLALQSLSHQRLHARTSSSRPQPEVLLHIFWCQHTTCVIDEALCSPYLCHGFGVNSFAID